MPIWKLIEAAQRLIAHIEQQSGPRSRELQALVDDVKCSVCIAPVTSIPAAKRRSRKTVV